jgi:S1-C subfamily serine protease
LDLASQRLGITVSEVNAKTRARYGLMANSGVVIVNLRRGSHLDRIGVTPGDIIHQIDEERVENLSDFKAAMVKYRDKPSVVLLVQRDAYLYYINAIMKENG